MVADGVFLKPFVYNPTSQIMVSYDDPTSFGTSFTFTTQRPSRLTHASPSMVLTRGAAAKGQFIVDQGLAGFAMWQAGGDYQDLLLDSINGAMGIDTTICDA